MTRSDGALRRLATEVESAFGTDVRVVVADLSTATGIDAVISAVSGLDVGLFVPAAGYGTSGLGQPMTIAIDVVGLGEDSGGQPSEASGRITQEFTACVTDVVE